MPSFGRRKALAVAALVVAAAVPISAVDAKSFTLRIGAGQEMKAVAPIFMANKYFVPTVKARVEKETNHKIVFDEAYGSAFAKPVDVLEMIEKGVFDIGLWCACSEPSKAAHLGMHYYLPFVTDDPVLQDKITRKTYKQFAKSAGSLSKYNQKWLGAGTFSSYGLGTKFKWSKMADLMAQLSAGTAVQTSLNEAYNSLQSGVYEGLGIFPTARLGFKLNEPAKVFTVVGWGSTSLYQMTMNLRAYDRLPSEIQKIIDEESEIWMDKSAQESSRRSEASLKKLKETGSTIQHLPFEERAKMAAALGDWPKQNPKKFDSQGLPGTALMKAYLKNAEAAGIKLPHKYDLD